MERPKVKVLSERELKEYCEACLRGDERQDSPQSSVVGEDIDQESEAA